MLSCSDLNHPARCHADILCSSTSNEPAAVGQKSHIMPAKANELYMTKGDCDLGNFCDRSSVMSRLVFYVLCKYVKGYQTIACVVCAALSTMMHA